MYNNSVSHLPNFASNYKGYNEKNKYTVVDYWPFSPIIFGDKQKLS